jgi:hypothetical protein
MTGAQALLALATTGIGYALVNLVTRARYRLFIQSGRTRLRLEPADQGRIEKRRLH